MTTQTQAQTSTTERCYRCGGLMVQERFTVGGEALDFEGRRCVICGEIVDPLIMANRLDHRRQRVTRNSNRKIKSGR